MIPNSDESYDDEEDIKEEQSINTEHSQSDTVHNVRASKASVYNGRFSNSSWCIQTSDLKAAFIRQIYQLFGDALDTF